MRTLNGLRLALFAAFVVLLTWRLYRPDPDATRSAHLHRGAMAGALVLAILAIFNDPGLLGGVVALGSLLAAGGFLLSR